MTERDTLHRFLFEDAGVRGELVQLDATWQAVLRRHDYPDAVRAQLGQALVASVLLAGTLKFKGSLILQARGDGPLHTLVAQATHRRTVRGLARWQGHVAAGGLPEVFGNGYLTLTIDTEGRDRYQGIVGLEGDDLAAAIKSYFDRSEQLDTRLWLTADGSRAVGLFIQELPSSPTQPADWERLAVLADTVRPEELLALPSETLLYRLFNQERVRLLEGEPVAFRCGCSRERIEATLKAMGQAEVESILEEQGSVEVDCEFCNAHYHFDAVDVERLFTEEIRFYSGTTRH